MEDRKWEISNIGEVKVSYVFNGSVKDRPIITSSYDAFRIAMKVLDQETVGMQEQFLAIYMNRAHRVIGAKVHFVGGVSSVIVDVKVIAATAVSLMASSVIVCHNHPSGSLQPSPQELGQIHRAFDSVIRAYPWWPIWLVKLGLDPTPKLGQKLPVSQFRHSRKPQRWQRLLR